MTVEINGVKYEPVDTEIKDDTDWSCRECDIYQARVPRSMAQFPLCHDKGNKRILISCCSQIKKGIRRIWRKVQ